MDAHCGAKYFEDAGLEVRLMSPEYVRSYVQAQTSANRDAEAIVEAATRQIIRFVPLSKTGAEVLFEVISQHYERGWIIMTSNRPSTNGPSSSDPSASQMPSSSANQ